MLPRERSDAVASTFSLLFFVFLFTARSIKNSPSMKNLGNGHGELFSPLTNFHVSPTNLTGKVDTFAKRLIPSISVLGVWLITPVPSGSGKSMRAAD